MKYTVNLYYQDGIVTKIVYARWIWQAVSNAIDIQRMEKDVTVEPSHVTVTQLKDEK